MCEIKIRKRGVFALFILGTSEASKKGKERETNIYMYIYIATYCDLIGACACVRAYWAGEERKMVLEEE